jgi:hypothetical protein
MAITAIKDLETPWAPYAVTFSHDGGRLAIGGGSWHGNGGIILAALDDWQSEPLDWDEVPWVAARGLSRGTTTPSGVPAVSSVCFSDDDRLLAASMWSSRQNYAPTMTFAVDGTHLRLRDLFDYQGIDTVPLPDGRTLTLKASGTPTGVLLHDGLVITRMHDSSPDGNHVLIVDRLPDGIDLPASGSAQCLTHNRLVVVRNTAITEAGGSRTVRRRQSDGTYLPWLGPEGLALRDLQELEAPLTVVPVQSSVRVTAIAALPGNQEFVTGGYEGEVDRWSWNDGWRQHRLRQPVIRAAPQKRTRVDATIEAIVVLAVSGDIVAVSAAGELLVLRSGREVESGRLAQRGTPQSLAAHPGKPWVAVGIKQGGFFEPQSVVSILAIES